MIMGKRRDIAGFERSAADAARALLDAASVSVVSHIDADGITAAAIASAALSRREWNIQSALLRSSMTPR